MSKEKVHIKIETIGLRPEEDAFVMLALYERLDEVMEFLGYKESEVKVNG